LRDLGRQASVKVKARPRKENLEWVRARPCEETSEWVRARPREETSEWVRARYEMVVVVYQVVVVTIGIAMTTWSTTNDDVVAVPTLVVWTSMDRRSRKAWKYIYL